MDAPGEAERLVPGTFSGTSRAKVRRVTVELHRGRAAALRAQGLLVAMLVAACGGDSKVAKGPKVQDVDIVGNDGVDDDAINEGLAMHPPEGIIFKDYARYDPMAMRMDVDRIVGFYKRRGYYGAEVTGTEVLDVDDGVEVKYSVNEGMPTHVVDVSVEGLPQGIDRHAAAHSIDMLEEGRVFKYEAYEEAVKSLETFLITQGYAHATVDGAVRVNRDTQRADVDILAQSGPLVYFGKIEVEGNDDVPAESVLARVSWEEGEVFDPRELERTQQRLYGMGLFGAVRTDYEREGKPRVADITVRVSETETRRLRLGGGFALDTRYREVRLRGGYEVTGWPDKMSIFRADLRPAYRIFTTQQTTDEPNRGFGGEARIEVERPDIFTPLLTLNTEITYQQTQLDSYSYRGPGTRLGLGYSFLESGLRLGAGWRFRYLTLFNIAQPIVDQGLEDELEMGSPYRLGAYEQSIVLDRRNSLLDATEGYYLEGRLHEGAPYAGGEFTFGRGTAEARGYVPAGPRVVLASRVRYGQELWGELPVTERFFSGGASSHRGFSQRRLSPVVVGDDIRAIVGGDALLETSWEVRVDIVKLWDNYLGIVPFADGGDVTRAVGDIQLTNLHWAGGLGLRYNTIVGPIRLDVARRLTRTNGEYEPGDVWAFHFSLGEAF